MKLISLLLLCRLAGDPIDTGLQIKHLTGDFYIYTTWHSLQGTPYPANGMYMVSKAGIVLFDTPWDTTQFQPLLDSIAIRHHQKVVACLSTHFHDDRTAGLDYFREHGIATWSSELTRELCRKEGNPLAEHVFIHDTTFTIGGHTLRTFYPGEGHTKDNIVIWFPAEKILYGGCLIKSMETNSIGNTGDANIREWPRSVSRIMQKFPDIRFVIPGHQAWGGKEQLRHTLDITEHAALPAQ